VNGLLNKIERFKPILIHGFAITLALVLIQLLLDALQTSFLLYMPPVGFALFLFTSYGIQPIMIGALNIVLLHRLYDCEGWQIGFWLNGFFLLLTFSTVTLLLQTMTGLSFFPFITMAEILIMPYPFGYLGKFSNRGTLKTVTPA
jgi:hypothetical protein